MSEKKVWRVPAVCERYDCSRASLHRWIRDHNFPAPARMGNSIVWFDEQLDEYDAALIEAAKKSVA